MRVAAVISDLMLYSRIESAARPPAPRSPASTRRPTCPATSTWYWSTGRPAERTGPMRSPGRGPGRGSSCLASTRTSRRTPRLARPASAPCGHDRSSLPSSRGCCARISPDRTALTLTAQRREASLRPIRAARAIHFFRPDPPSACARRSVGPTGDCRMAMLPLRGSAMRAPARGEPSAQQTGPRAANSRGEGGSDARSAQADFSPWRLGPGRNHPHRRRNALTVHRRPVDRGRSVPDPAPEAANQTCQQLANTDSAGIDLDRAQGRSESGGPWAIQLQRRHPTATITDASEAGFDWTSNIGVDAVFVKSGSTGTTSTSMTPLFSRLKIRIPKPFPPTFPHCGFAAHCGRDEAERHDHGQALRDGHLLSERRRMGLDLFVVRTTRSREGVVEHGQRAPSRVCRTRESGQ